MPKPPLLHTAQTPRAQTLWPHIQVFLLPAIVELSGLQGGLVVFAGTFGKRTSYQALSPQQLNRLLADLCQLTKVHANSSAVLMG